MNNKGQSLVLFVILIPILFMILFMVYEVGRMALLKHELNDISYLAIDCGLDKIDEEDNVNNIRELINKNKNDIDNIEVKIEDEKIDVTLEDSIKTNISLIRNAQTFRVKSSYVGYMNEEKKVIERDR